jgi:hypothetical protein
MLKKIARKVKTAAAKRKAASKPKAETDIYLLLDRSGSMSVRWDESLKSINDYVAGLRRRKVSGNAVLALFDENGGLKFEIVRNDAIKNWTPVSSADGRARGMTPLYDAVGRIVALADRNAPDKAVIMIVTDGHENASLECTRERAKALLDQCRARGWQVVMLGADFENAQQAADLGAARAQTIVMRGARGMNVAMCSLASMTDSYSTGASTAMSFTDDDRLKAANDNNKPRSRAA